jgi:hypothetical protein
LIGLADELARRANAATGAGDDSTIAPAEIIEEASRGGGVERDEQPVGSRAIFAQRSDGVTITVPPLGIRALRDDRGLIAAVCLSIVLVAWIVIGSAPVIARDGPVGVFTFPGAIIAWPGIVILLSSATISLRRSAELAARGGLLNVRWTGLIVTRERTWRRDELAEIRAISERVKDEGGKAWSQYLAIRACDPAAPDPVRLLDWCEKAELEWVATKLRAALGMSADEPKPKAHAGCRDDDIG